MRSAILEKEVEEVKNNKFPLAAEMDPTQSFRFYYGNAAKDLAHLLPSDDPTAPSHEIWDSLEQSERLLWQIQASQEKLSFLVADLKRLIR